MPIAKSGSLLTIDTDGSSPKTPSSASLTSGGIVSAWSVASGPAQNPDYAVFGSVLLPNGTQTEPFALNSTTGGNTLAPLVIGLAGGGFVAVWTAAGASGDGDADGVRARLFSANGTPLGNDFLVNADTIASQTALDVTALSTGGFVVTYLSSAAQTGNVDDYNLISRTFDSSGTPGAEIQINPDDATIVPALTFNISVSALAGGKFVTLWQSYDANFHVQIQGQVASATGLVGDIFSVPYDTSNLAGSPTSTALTSGRVVTAWMAAEITDATATSFLFGRILDANGKPTGQDFTISLATGNAQALTVLMSPEVTALADGRFVASWIAVTNGVSKIGFRVFNADGTPAGSEGEHIAASGTAGGHSVVALADGRFSLSWSVEVQGGQVTLVNQIFDPKSYTGTSGNDTWNGGELADTINGGAGHDTLLGKGGADKINGGDGNDVLDGGSGTDSLNGGAGNDTYVLSNGTDTVTDTSGTDTITSTISRTLASYAAIEDLTLLGTANISGTGNDLNNTIIGNAGKNTLTGGKGNDTLDGGAGSDTINGGDGNDTYVLGNGSDKVIDASGKDTITSTITRSLAGYATIENLKLLGTAHINGTGNALANAITGNAGNNVLDGGTGKDTLDGGAGNDTYVLGADSDTIKDASGIDTITSSITRSLAGYTTIENLRLTGSANINATGNNLANVLTGNSGKNTLSGGKGNDTLNGGSGADILIGGSGNDTYVLGAENDKVTDSAGVDTITSTITRTLASFTGIENLTLVGSAKINATGNASANTLIGNAGVNTLSGGAGNDFLDGGAGKDTLDGGTGNDTYALGSESDKIKDASGVDTITSTISRSLASYTMIENLTLLGSAHINGTGNSLANTITGNSGNNILNGGAGKDILIGGAGNDTYVLGSETGDTISDASGIDTFTSTIARSLASYTKIENLTLLGSANINGTGNDLANTLTGNSGVNTLVGGKGNDILDGGAGADTLNGGEGNDTYVLCSATDTVVDSAGIDTITSTITRSLETYAAIENLTLLGTANINATGNGLNNRITGNAGNNMLDGGSGDDILDGGLGADFLEGGAGNDTYVMGDGNDAISDASGTDTITSTISRSLAGYADIENLILLGTSNIDGAGNVNNNTVTGNSGSNILRGFEGHDTLYGGAGNDMLEGNDGGDALYGGLGNDVLVGGEGSDSFLFNTKPHGTNNVDSIGDFSIADDRIGFDRVVFTGIGPVGALQATQFEQGATASTAAVRILFDDGSDQLFYDADGNGSIAPVLIARVADADLTFAHFFIF